MWRRPSFPFGVEVFSVFWAPFPRNVRIILILSSLPGSSSPTFPLPFSPIVRIIRSVVPPSLLILSFGSKGRKNHARGEALTCFHERWRGFSAASGASFGVSGCRLHFGAVFGLKWCFCNCKSWILKSAFGLSNGHLGLSRGIYIGVCVCSGRHYTCGRTILREQGRYLSIHQRCSFSQGISL